DNGDVALVARHTDMRLGIFRGSISRVVHIVDAVAADGYVAVGRCGIAHANTATPAVADHVADKCPVVASAGKFDAVNTYGINDVARDDKAARGAPCQIDTACGHVRDVVVADVDHRAAAADVHAVKTAVDVVADKIHMRTAGTHAHPIQIM